MASKRDSFISHSRLQNEEFTTEFLCFFRDHKTSSTTSEVSELAEVLADAVSLTSTKFIDFYTQFAKFTTPQTKRIKMKETSSLERLIKNQVVARRVAGIFTI